MMLSTQHTSVLSTGLWSFKNLQMRDMHLNFRVLNIRAGWWEVWGAWREIELKLQSEKIVLLKQNKSIIFKHLQNNIGYFISYS